MRCGGKYEKMRRGAHKTNVKCMQNREQMWWAFFARAWSYCLVQSILGPQPPWTSFFFKKKKRTPRAPQARGSSFLKGFFAQKQNSMVYVQGQCQGQDQDLQWVQRTWAGSGWRKVIQSDADSETPSQIWKGFPSKTRMEIARRGSFSKPAFLCKPKPQKNPAKSILDCHWKAY